MKNEIIKMMVPAVGESINEVTISAWLKKDGDIVELDEIIAETKGVGKQSKAVEREYLDIIYANGPEFNILNKMSADELFTKLPGRVAEGIKKVRDKNIEVIPGHDGEYGIIKIFKKEEEKVEDQLKLF